MHPLLLEVEVRYREEELRRAAARAVIRVPRPSLHERFGWLLVGAGLRLAGGRDARLDRLAAFEGIQTLGCQL